MVPVNLTLLKIIAGIDKDYQGEVVFSPGYSVGYLEQDPKLEPGKTVKEIVQEGVQEIVDTLKEYEEVNERFGDPEVLEDPDKMDAFGSTVRRSCRTRSTLRTHGTSTAVWNVPWTLCVVRRRIRWWIRCPEASVAGWPFADCCSSSRTYCCLDEPTNHLGRRVDRLVGATSATICRYRYLHRRTTVTS